MLKFLSNVLIWARAKVIKQGVSAANRAQLHDRGSNNAKKLVCLSFLFAVGAHAATTPTILVLGDSLSAGFGIKPEQAWPRLLETELKARGKAFQVINASISGDTTAGGKSRFPTLIKAQPAKLIIIELGANDGLRGLPLAEMQKNLATVITSAKATGSAVHLIGMQIPPNYGPAYTRAFVTTYQTLAKDYKVGFTPFLLAPIAQDRTLFQADQLHPIAKAQPLIMQGVLLDLLAQHKNLFK